jgi:hypothetical protein
MVPVVERLLRFVYDRSALVRSGVRRARIAKFSRVVRAGGPPFNDDSFLQEAVATVLGLGQVAMVIETGTYLAYTTRWLASRFPHLPVLTVEASPVYYQASAAVLRALPNVTQLEGNSADVLAQLYADGRVAGCPFLFLDAHWNEYLPLPDELRLIGAHSTDAIMLIHDFAVPDQPQFRFDTYHGQPIGMDLLRQALVPGRPYTLLLPQYRPEEVYGPAAPGKPPLRGHCWLFQGAAATLEAFLATAAGRRYRHQSIRRDA